MVNTLVGMSLVKAIVPEALGKLQFRTPVVPSESSLEPNVPKFHSIYCPDEIEILLAPVVLPAVSVWASVSTTISLKYAIVPLASCSVAVLFAVNAEGRMLLVKALLVLFFLKR